MTNRQLALPDDEAGLRNRGAFVETAALGADVAVNQSVTFGRSLRTTMKSGPIRRLVSGVNQCQRRDLALPSVAPDSTECSGALNYARLFQRTADPKWRAVNFCRFSVFLYARSSDCRIARVARPLAQSFTLHGLRLLAPCHPIGLPSRSERILNWDYYRLLFGKSQLYLSPRLRPFLVPSWASHSCIMRSSTQMRQLSDSTHLRQRLHLLAQYI